MHRTLTGQPLCSAVAHKHQRTSPSQVIPPAHPAVATSSQQKAKRIANSQWLWRSNRRCTAVHGARTANTADPWWEKNSTPNMRQIHGVQEFVDELDEASDTLVIVDFYAKWCHACKALYPKLCQISSDNPDIKLLKVDWDENKEICKTLGVRVLPFFHMYRGAEGKVAEFSASVAKVQRLRDALEDHKAARCSLGANPTLKEFKVEPSHQLDHHELPKAGELTILDSTGENVLFASMASMDEEADQSEESKEREPEPAM